MKINSPEEIEEAISIFMVNLELAANSASPPTAQASRQHHIAELNTNAAALLCLKRRVRKEYVRTGDERLNQIYKRLANRLQKVLRRTRQAKLDELLENASRDLSSNYSLWKLTIRFKRQATLKAPLKNPAGDWCNTGSQKAETFADMVSIQLVMNER
ncbi:hypothetical protein ACLKA6_000261 [Drosophila palustris]